MAGFLGMESLKEEYKGKNIAELILDLTVQATQALKDPILILFGSKFMKLKLRKGDRKFLNLSALIDKILADFIKKEEKKANNQEYTENKKSSLLDLLLLERKKLNMAE